jgi:CDP-glucose 4,6-dehydratase
MKINKNFWKGKKVFLTGHTGFKGSWFVILLNMLGAKVCGYSLKPQKKNLFELAGIKKLTENSIFGDIRNFSKLKKSIKRFNPDFIVHMAAQPLVKTSYEKTKYTYEVNTIGTLNILEVLNQLNSIKKTLIITTDKVYENNGKKKFYKESDRLAGEDPYSNSKACAELIVKSYNQSFFKKKDIHVATARAGNVIGGGDYSLHRIIPDYFRALYSKNKLVIRNPYFVRPWQHVIEPLYGYLLVLQKLKNNKYYNENNWNFGPKKNNNKKVLEIINLLNAKFNNPVKVFKENKKDNHYESKNLMLNSFKAQKYLSWNSKLNISQSLDLVADWYKNTKKEKNYLGVCKMQIKNYFNYL